MVNFDITPKELEILLDKNLEQKEFYSKLAPSHKRAYNEWIASAKKSETREKRATKALEMLKRNQKTLKN